MPKVQCHSLKAWNHAAVHAFGDISVDSSAPRFAAVMDARAWPGVQLVRVDSPAARVQGALRGGRAGWYLLCNDRGSVTLRQDGRCVDLQDGELSLLRADRPYDISFADANRMLVVTLPSFEAPASLQTRLLQRHARDEAAVIVTLLQRVQGMDEHSAAALDAQALRAAIVDLLVLMRPALACGSSATARPTRGARWWRQAAGLVEAKLADPALGAASIGAALGLSTRYVQLLFEREGTSVSAFVLERRLQRAAAALRDQPRRSIAELAFDVGFSDLSYFCRCFRKRFGCSAREWRRPN